MDRDRLGESESSVAARTCMTAALGALGFERALVRRRKTLRGLPGCPSPMAGLRSGEDAWPGREPDDERVPGGDGRGAEEERSPIVFTCNDIFSRETVALLDKGGRENILLVDVSAERSESEGRETEPEGVCLAGLLMRRLMSRWPLASRSEDMPDVLCGPEAVKDRAG